MSRNGGPAFPVQMSGGVHASGMSLRDWFAGMAMQGLVASSLSYSTRAALAYELADAMLAERER